jgi:Zn-finger nucleic acid-binding protein
MKCPHCGITWLPDELEDIGNIGCSSCRRVFDIGELEQDDRIFTPEEVADWFIKQND